MEKPQPLLPADERRARRSRVLIGGFLVFEGQKIPVRLSDLSPHGALVSGRALPVADSQIELQVAGKAVSGWIAWSEGGRAGLNFDGGAIDMSHFGTQRVDTAQHVVRDGRPQIFKRPGFRNVRLTSEERMLVATLRRT